MNIFSSIPIDQIKFTPSSSADTEPIDLSYQMNYVFKNNTRTIKDNLIFSLSINGTNGLKDQGTINYSLSKNPQDDPFIQALLWEFELTGELMLFPIDFTSSHYQTYFSNRKESFSPDCSDANSSYTLFWLNSNIQPVHQNAVNKIVPFFEVNSPTRFSIKDDLSDLSYNSLSPEIQELEKNTPIISAYFVQYSAFIKDSFDLKIKLYYDVNWTVLLYGHIEYRILNPIVHTDIDVEILLKEKSIDFSFQTENPYWLAALSRYYTILSFSLLGVGIISGIVYFRRKKIKSVNK